MIGEDAEIKNTNEEHNFKLFCDPSKPEKLKVKWGKDDHDDKGREFKLQKITQISCTNDPNLPPDPAGFNTVTGTGSGTYNGRPGATIVFKFTDGDDPGPNKQKDFASIKIVDHDGNVKLNVAGPLNHGKQEPHK